MAARLIFGSYWPTDSFWHRRDPRTVLVTSIGLLSFTLLLPTLWVQVIITIIIYVLCRSARIPFWALIQSVKSFSLILLFTFIINLISVSSKVNIMNIAYFSSHLSFTLFFTVRLLNTIFIATWLLMIVRVTTLVNVIISVLRPLCRWVPINELAIAMGIAIRFFPLLQEEAEEIILAQRARSRGSNGSSLKTVRVLLPMLVGTLRRAGDLAKAIEARGYVLGKNQTIWPFRKWNKRESIILVAIIVTLLIVNYVLVLLVRSF